ncbi:MAG: sigma-70 family RNA polymerase sigma factor [Acidobacteria bacterium]|nr:sigma-70 family RNA polymerase sigma factor [Acidobacteriota bacterium]
MADTTIGFELEGPVGQCDFPVAMEEARAEEDALIEGLRLGVEQAYETLIPRFQQPIYNLVYRLLSDPTEACDVVQEVFLKVFRNIGAFRGQSSLKTWVYRIAVNEAHNHRRWFGRHRRQEVGLDREEENNRSYQEILPDPGSSPFDSVLSHERHELIEQALATMNPIFRSVVVLRDIEDLSYEEIANVLQVSLGTVKSRILRGREALREALADRLEPAAATPWTAPQAGGGELGSVKP